MTARDVDHLHAVTCQVIQPSRCVLASVAARAQTATLAITSCIHHTFPCESEAVRPTDHYLLYHCLL